MLDKYPSSITALDPALQQQLEQLHQQQEPVPHTGEHQNHDAMLQLAVLAAGQSFLRVAVSMSGICLRGQAPHTKLLRLGQFTQQK